MTIVAALVDYWSADVTAAVVTSAGIVLAASVTAYAHVAHKLRGIGKDAAQTREQVKNDHGTNLRDDVDRALEGVADARKMSQSNQAAIVALAAEVKHLTAALERRRSWWRR